MTDERRPAPRGYDANPTMLRIDPHAYERYAARLDEWKPDWFEDDETKMVPELAELALKRREVSS